MPGTPPDAARGGARALARRAMIQQIAAMALDVFEERGYDTTTVDDLCTAAGISRTTFFRYFPTKEDVLMRDFDGLGETIRDALASRPEDESAWTALCRAIEPVASTYAGDKDDSRPRRVIGLVMRTPTLGLFHQAKLAAWIEQLRPEVERRLGVRTADRTDPRPTALIAAALACLDAALAAWVWADGGKELSTLFAQASESIGDRSQFFGSTKPVS